MRKTEMDANKILQTALDHGAYVTMQIVAPDKIQYEQILMRLSPDFTINNDPSPYGIVSSTVFMADRKATITVSYYKPGSEQIITEKSGYVIGDNKLIDPGMPILTDSIRGVPNGGFIRIASEEEIA